MYLSLYEAVDHVGYANRMDRLYVFYKICLCIMSKKVHMIRGNICDIEQFTISFERICRKPVDWNDILNCTIEDNDIFTRVAIKDFEDVENKFFSFSKVCMALFESITDCLDAKPSGATLAALQGILSEQTNKIDTQAILVLIKELQGKSRDEILQDPEIGFKSKDTYYTRRSRGMEILTQKKITWG